MNEPAPLAPADTSLDALRAQYSALRRLSVAQRLALMDDLTALVRSMCREGIRRRHPRATEDEIDALFCELTLGKVLAAQVLAHRRSGAEGPAP